MVIGVMGNYLWWVGNLQQCGPVMLTPRSNLGSRYLSLYPFLAFSHARSHHVTLIWPSQTTQTYLNNRESVRKHCPCHWLLRLKIVSYASFFAGVDVCSKAKCGPHGTCIPDSKSAAGYVCRCQPGWCGSHCNRK